jgi:hypothetical protein
MERDSRTGTILCLAMKYWLIILHMENEDSVEECYEWQIKHFNIQKLDKEIKRGKRHKKISIYLPKSGGEY